MRCVKLISKFICFGLHITIPTIIQANEPVDVASIEKAESCAFNDAIEEGSPWKLREFANQYPDSSVTAYVEDAYKALNTQKYEKDDTVPLENLLSLGWSGKFSVECSNIESQHYVVITTDDGRVAEVRFHNGQICVDNMFVEGIFRRKGESFHVNGPTTFSVSSRALPPEVKRILDDNSGNCEETKKTN